MKTARRGRCWVLAGALVTGAACGHGSPPQPGATPDALSRAVAELESPPAAVVAPPAAPEPVAGAPAEPEPTAEPEPEPMVSALVERIPPLEARPSSEVEARWRAIKKVKDLSAQAARLDAERLERVRCEGLVDFRALTEGRAPGFAYRDDVRGRSWVHPALARALVEANAALRAEYPTAVVTVGDITQPGCGQVSHGALVREVRGAEALALVNRARLLAGVPTVREWRPAASWPSERMRFAGPDELVMQESALVAQTPDRAPGDPEWAVRAIVRRYRRLLDADADTRRDLDEISQRLMKDGILIRAREVAHWDAERGEHTVWLQHWVSPDEGRQMVALSRKPQKRRLDLDALVEVRLSRWQPGKPDSFPSELRWVSDRAAPPADEGGAAPAAAAAVTWQRWELVYEAGHQTHLAGRDADLSFVTHGNTDHFAINLDAIDVAATWRWFELLDQATRKAGTPLERVLVDVKVNRLFKAKLPRKKQRSKLWRQQLRLASGHDAHHHVRVQAPEAAPADVARHLEAIDRVLGPRAAEGPRVGAPPTP